MDDTRADVVMVGAGAAGLMTAIALGRALEAEDGGRGQKPRIMVVDGAARLGAKILVAGGGRCNVTHGHVDHRAFAGSSPNAIRHVLGRFTADDTAAFFEGLGVKLKRESTGKLFPVTDKARTVLEALLGECARLGIEQRHPWRVGEVAQAPGGGFVLRRETRGLDKQPSDAGDDPPKTRPPSSPRPSPPENTAIVTPRLVLATGGQSLPRTGSDGAGYDFARALGHTITPRLFPALVPLVIGEESRWITELSGISARVTVQVRAGTGKRVAAFTDDVLCTHFGLSGPGILDASRWLTARRAEDPAAHLVINWLPNHTFESIDRELQRLGSKTLAGALRQDLPQRLALALIAQAKLDPATPGHALGREARRPLAHRLTETKVDVAGDRGFTHAEVTAGGVPLAEVDPKTMRSRACPRLWIVGEMLDVDGRIGGYNFQWAWAGGTVAGRDLAQAMRG